VTDPVEPDVERTLIPYWDWNANQPDVPRNPAARLRIERHNQRVLRQALEGFRPDVLSVWNMCGLSMSLLTESERRGLPIVITVENEWLRLAPEQDGWTRMWWRRGIHHPVSALGVPTQLPTYETTSASFASDFMLGTVPREITDRFRATRVIHLGVDLGAFPLTEPDVREWRWRLLFVGRLDPAKGIETLLRALAHLPRETTLRIIGGSGADYQHALADLAGSLGIGERVSFERRTREEIRSAYLDADAVVFPSEWQEPFGIVPLEAMACATPVVTTRQGGSAEFLDDGVNCLAFEPGDNAALAAAVGRLAADPAIRHRLVSGGLTTAGRLTSARHAAAVLQMHEDAAEQTA
jgi:glycosyltransferase involved in cell wall biosynthesis